MIKIGYNIFLVSLFFFTSCSLKFIPLSRDEKAKSIELISKASSQITQIKASIDIRATGFLGHFFHEQADIIVQEPQNLLFFVKSFIGPPSVIVASNDSFVTMYDFSLNGENNYTSIDYNKNTFFTFFETKIYPKILIELMLNKVLLSGVENLEIYRNKNSYKITGTREQNWQIYFYFDENKRYITEINWHNQELDLQYTATYKNFTNINGIYFPKEMVFSIKDKSRETNFKFLINEVVLNGANEDKEIFYLKPPK